MVDRLPTLLLVEDEDVLRLLLSRYLVRLGFHVLTADSGEEALRTIQGQPDPPSLLVTDIMLPGMTGLELALQLRERNPKLRTILITAYPPEFLAKHGVRLGEFPLLNKPFASDDLRRAISELLGILLPVPTAHG